MTLRQRYRVMVRVKNFHERSWLIPKIKIIRFYCAISRAFSCDYIDASLRSV
jgi:hypothetical protein